jgi:hypothetical protein
MTNGTTVGLDDGQTVRATLDELLLPQDRQLGRSLAAHLPAPGAPAKAFVARLVLRELRRVFPQSLVDVLETGLRGHTALQDAARTTLADGSTRADVTLYQRKLHTTHTVTVDVLATLVRFEVEAVLAVDFAVMDASAEVTQGRLGALTMRDPALAGELSMRVDGVDTGPLCHREGTLHLGGRVPFDPPRQILADREEQLPAGSLPAT